MENNAEETAGSKENKIVLTLLNGTGYIFDVDDYMRLRREHHITGSMVGTCATKGWSANDCTMPVELASWETRLLVEEGLAVLVSKKYHLLRNESGEELKNYQDQLEKRINQQEETLKDEKMKETTRNVDKVILGKTKKLLKQGVPKEEINLNPLEILEEIRRGIAFDRKNALLDIPCSHTESHDSYQVNISLPDNSLKYLVFRDFWSRGKYVTCGDAFGADFLIYPGDPLQYHASHIVVLLENAKIRGLELVTKVRLSVTVNKLCVLAYFEDDETKSEDGLTAGTSQQSKPDNNLVADARQQRVRRKIAYQTLSWLGDKDKERRQTALK